MKKFAKKLLMWSGIFIGVIILCLVVIAAFFEEQISDRLVTEINKQLKTELKVGEFNLSLLSGFPNASANLHDVLLDDAMNGTLLEAENLSFRFGLFSLFGSNIKVKSMVIEDGSLYIRTDKKGRTNFDIVKKSNKSSKATTTDSEFALSLDEARLNRVEVIYVDQRIGQHARFHVNKAVASGEFSTEKFSLTSFADIQSHFYEADGEKILVDQEVIYDAKVDVDFVNGRYGFEDVTVGVADNVFNVDGMIKQKKGATDYDLRLTGEEGSIAAIFALLPEQQQEYFSDFESSGTFYFDATIKGKSSATVSPAITAKFGLDDGKISSEKLYHPLKDVSFSARFTNGKQHNARNSIFEISDFKGFFGRDLIEGGLRISNLENPLIDFKLDGVIPLEAVYGLFDTPIITDGDGDVELKDVQLKGRYKDIISPYGVARVNTSGEVEFEDAELTINGEEVLMDKGLFRFQDNSLTVEDIVLETDGTEIELNGTFLNLLPVIFADSINSKHAELKFNASLDAKTIDLDKLLALTEIPLPEPEVQVIAANQAAKGGSPQQSMKTINIQRRERITNFLKGKFTARIQDFNYEKIEGKDFNGTLEFDNNEMTIKGRVKTMDGRMIVDGTTFFKDKPYLEAKLTCEQLNVKEFFRQAENFGQEVLIDKNLRGKLDAKLFINVFWDENATLLTDKLHVLGDVDIFNGELVNMKMLYDFSDYINIRDLRHIKFTHLHNYIEVKKEKVFLPSMFIQSNALNLTISGKHSFENKIDYNVKVNAGQVIANKLKKHDPTLKPQKAKKNGWFNLYYRIYGPVATFKYESDKKRVKRAFTASDARKRRIQKELIAHFGNIVSAEVPKEWDDQIPEYEEEELGEDEYIEWDETESNF